MANNYLAIVADVKTKLTAVPGVGIVHDYERWAVDWSRFIEFFKDPTGKINGWEITRVAVSEHCAGVYFRHHRFLLKGYRGVKDADASGKEFQVLIEEICNGFRKAEPAAGNATWGYSDGDNPANSPVQVPLINDRMFGAVLCHCAEIALSVTERIL